MALTTDSAKGKPAPKPDANPAPKPAAKPAAAKLRPASESGDPAVHQLIAESDIARQNGDSDRVSELTAALAKLGFSG